MPLFRKSLLILALLTLPVALPTVATGAARTISWSGYTWDVRPAGTAQEPGPNDWSDSTANVQVQGSDLLLSIVKDSSGNWTSSEVDNQQHLGYGTYRWVVATNLSALDANEVLGMFTYGGSDPSNNEIDIEPSHWGDISNPSGSATVWQNANAGLSEARTLNYSSDPPYVNQFTWSPGRIDYLITDATGATLFAWTVTTGVPTPSTEVPVINYWRFKNIAPSSVRTMRISSFAWAPLGQSLPPLIPTPGAGSPSPGPGGVTGTPSARPVRGAPTHAPNALRRVGLTCSFRAPGAAAASGQHPRVVNLSVSMQPSRFSIARFHNDGVLQWSATGAVRLKLVVRRWLRDKGFVRIAALPQFVPSGPSRSRLPAKLGGRAVGPGTYSVGLSPGARTLRCVGAHFLFTVT